MTELRKSSGIIVESNPRDPSSEILEDLSGKLVQETLTEAKGETCIEILVECLVESIN